MQRALHDVVARDRQYDRECHQAGPLDVRERVRRALLGDREHGPMPEVQREGDQPDPPEGRKRQKHFRAEPGGSPMPPAITSIVSDDRQQRRVARVHDRRRRRWHAATL